MSGYSVIPTAITVNGTRLYSSSDIGFSDSDIVQQERSNNASCGGGGGGTTTVIYTRCAETGADGETSEDNGSCCGTDNELTGNSRENVDLHSVLDVNVNNYCGARGKTSKSSGIRPRVAFAAMDENDSNSNKRDISRDLNKLSKKGTGSIRYTQPRLSLLGKPINYKMHKRDARYRRLQSRIYNFLERPKVWWAFLYHIIVLCLLIGWVSYSFDPYETPSYSASHTDQSCSHMLHHPGCGACIAALICSTLSTIKKFEPQMSTTVMILEPVLLVWLLIEYSLRIWSSGCRSRYQGWKGRMKFAQRPLCIADVVILLSTLLVLVIGGVASSFPASTLRGLRFFQILRMVRIDRKAGTWKLLASVVWAHRRELMTTLYIGFLGLLFTSYVVYLVEREENPDRFGTYADALWWGVVTLCTVGYGDVVPETWAGKLIASFSAVLGIAFFALPAGILGSGFALKVQQQQRQKHLIRRRVPAAQLIQSLWRCYAADENSMSLATWKPHMIPCPSPTQERPMKANASFVSRFSTRRKERQPPTTRESVNGCPHSPMITRRENRKHDSVSEEDVPDTLQRSHLSLATGLVDQRVDKLALVNENNSGQSICSKNEQSEEEVDLSPKVRELTEVHKKAIRALRKIKYFVSRRKFREALRPYDVKDVIEQYSAGHVDMLGRVKSLQCRLDQILGKSGSKNKDVYESKVSLSSRIVKVERQVEDIESKLDLLIDLYKEDRKVLIDVQRALPDISPDKDSQKPRSILVDKQYTSEPSSPISNKHPKRVMQRNHSDLGSRIRKRVTYKLHTGTATSPPPATKFGKDLIIPENVLSRHPAEPHSAPPAIHTEETSFIIPETRFSLSPTHPTPPPIILSEDPDCSIPEHPEHVTNVSIDIIPSMNENDSCNDSDDEERPTKDSETDMLLGKHNMRASCGFSNAGQGMSEHETVHNVYNEYRIQGDASSNEGDKDSDNLSGDSAENDCDSNAQFPSNKSVDDILSEPNDVCTLNSICVHSTKDTTQRSNDIGHYQNCKPSPEIPTSDHVVLLPLGSPQALISDVTDV